MNEDMDEHGFEQATLRACLTEWRKGCSIAEECCDYGRTRAMDPADCEACTEAFLDAVVFVVSPKDPPLTGLTLQEALFRQCLVEKLGFYESLALAYRLSKRKPLANEEK